MIVAYVLGPASELATARDAKGVAIAVCRGVIDIPGMLTALLEVGFTRHVALEYEKDDENSLPGMIKSYAYMRAHWRR